MFDENIGLEFPVTVYGNLEKYNETISKGRCRIFYKYGNRNGTYITDEFAEKLLSTIPYAPVKGIYEGDEGDYTDHGKARSQGRIYGIVPENPNLSWEDHEDEDGVVRTYACVDVLIFTGLYTEANAIVGKSQSMEIYPPSIKGAWKIINGKKYYVYEEGHFLGLQVLGDAVEPCFEGAAFFSLDDLRGTIKKMEQYLVQFEKKLEDKQMIVNFKLSDERKANQLWSLLNPNCTEEGGYVINYEICEVYDNYAVCWNYDEQIFERVYYTKNDENDSVEIVSKEQCFIVDVTAAERDSLRLVQALNENTFENLDKRLEREQELDGQVGELNTKIEALERKTEEFETQISTYNTEKETFTQQIETLESDKNSLQEQVDALSTYKANIEKQDKLGLIETYSNKLDQSILDTFVEEVDKYTYEALDRELAYTLVKSNPANFALDSKKHYVPKDNVEKNGINAILERYTNN